MPNSSTCKLGLVWGVKDPRPPLGVGRTVFRVRKNTPIFKVCYPETRSLLKSSLAYPPAARGAARRCHFSANCVVRRTTELAPVRGMPPLKRHVVPNSVVGEPRRTTELGLRWRSQGSKPLRRANSVVHTTTEMAPYGIHIARGILR